MSGLLYASQKYRKSPPPPPWRVFVDGRPAAKEELQRLAVQSEAQPFEDYAKRLELEFPKQDVSIILDRCEKGLPRVRRSLMPLLHDLFSIVGYPARLNHACLYAGRYRTTAFGIHKDPCHVLMFCGIGKKVMAFWPPDYFASHEGINDRLPYADVSQYLRDATILEITPRDLLYWPADYWHVSISEADHFNAAISLGIYHRGTSVEQFLSTDFLKTQSPATWVKDYPAWDIHGIQVEAEGRLSPTDLRQTDFNKFFDYWNQVLEILSKPGEREFHALKLALELITSAGFGKLPQAPLPSPRHLAGAILSCEVPQALMTAASKDGLLVGANGSVSFHAFDVETIDVVVEQLRTGNQVVFDSLLASTTSGQQVCTETVLRHAIEAGAIDLIENSQKDMFP